jgi:hypothetical protein
MPDRKPYTHVRLILEEEPLRRYEVRVSHYVEYDDNPGRRAVTGKPTKEEALEQAREIARAEQAKLDRSP